MKPVLHWRGVMFPSKMEGFVITWILEPFNMTWRVDGVASTIVGIFMHDENHFAMIGMEKGSTCNKV